MLRVGICDENTQDRKEIRTIITQTLFQQEKITCVEYAHVHMLEEEIEEEKVPFDVLILEMEYKKKNGLQLARRIREKNLDVDIIFVTNQTAYVYEGYHVQAIGYVIKKNMEKELAECLQRYIVQRGQTGILTVKSESVYRAVPIVEVQYIESNRRVLLLHTDTETIPFYGKLADVESQVVNYGFIRIHQSFLVKKTEIQKIDGTMAVLGDDCRLPISRKYYKLVQEQFKTKQGIRSSWENVDPTITRSLAGKMDDNGAIIGTKGELLGVIYRMKKGECLKVGRDASMCQITLEKPEVSREHCIIKRLDNCNYEIEDCSKNGVYLEGNLIGRGNRAEACAGNCVWICDASQEFRFG